MKKKYNMTYANPKMNPNMSMAPVKKPWTPQKGIPDQSKLKNIGVGWGGEKPSYEKNPVIKLPANVKFKK